MKKKRDPARAVWDNTSDEKKAAMRAHVSKLTSRQETAFELLRAGYSGVDIAALMDITYSCVNQHLDHAYHRLERWAERAERVGEHADPLDCPVHRLNLWWDLEKSIDLVLGRGGAWREVTLREVIDGWRYPVKGVSIKLHRDFLDLLEGLAITVPTGHPLLRPFEDQRLRRIERAIAAVKRLSSEDRLELLKWLTVNIYPVPEEQTNEMD